MANVIPSRKTSEILRVLAEGPVRQAQERFVRDVQTFAPRAAGGLELLTPDEIFHNQRPGAFARPVFNSSQRLFYGGGGSSGGGGVSGMTDPNSIEAALKEREKSKARAEAGVKPSKSLLSRLGSLPGDVVGAGFKGIMRGFDLLGRPGYAASNILLDRVKQMKEGDWASALGFKPQEYGHMLGAGWRGLAGYDKTTGSDVLKEVGVKNSLLRGIGGFGLDLATDPLTYVSLGTSGALKAGTKEVAEELAKAGVSGTRQRLIKDSLKALKRETQKGALRGTKKLTEKEVESAILPAIMWNAENLPKSTLGRRAAAAAEKASLVSGKTAQEATKAGTDAAIAYAEKANEVLKGSSMKALENMGKSQLEVRLGFLGRGKNVLPERVGQALYSAVDRPIGFASKTGAGKAFKNWFDYESHFPGLTGRIRSAVQSGSVARMDALRDEVMQTFKGTTINERKELSHAIDQKLDLTGRFSAKGHDMQALKEKGQDIFRRMKEEEVNLGIRNADEPIDDSYVYQWYKTHRNWKLAEKFRADRKAILSKPGTTVTPLNLTLQAAKDAGLNPEEDLAKILMARGSKSYRDQARQFFNTEVLNTYGKMSTEGPLSNAASLGFDTVSNSNVPKQLKELAAKQNGQWYLQKDMNKVFNSYGDMVRFHNSHAVNSFLRNLDNTNRWFKFSRTVLRPTYHINNMMTDAALSWIDGTTGRDYWKLFNRWRQARSGAAPVLKIGGNDVTWDEFRNLFKDTASGQNFMHTEVPPSLVMNPGNVVTNPLQTGKAAVGSVLGTARRGSEARETFFRAAHYQRAFEEELPTITKGKTLYGKARKDALEEAANRAASRVNKFNVDFSALTPNETQYLRRVVPFYTFMRKATPTMVQAAATQPGRVLALQKASRAVQNALGTRDDDAFSPLRWPDYLRDSDSFLQLTKGEEPWYFDMGQLPQFGLLNPMGTEGPSTGLAGQQNVSSSLLSKLNPLITMLPELERGKKYFANQGAGSVGEWANNTFNPFDYLLKANRAREKGGTAAALLSQINTRKLPTDRQLASIKADTRQYKDTNAQLNKILESQGYQISTSQKKTGTTYKLIDRIHGRVLGEFKTPAAAQKAADRIMGRG